jgi:hypothetical protein
MTTHKLNGAFKETRDALVSALAELKAAESEYGDLLNCEARLQDDLDALASKFKATNESDVERKTKLTQQVTEVRAQSRAVEKRLAKCREVLAGALNSAVEPYRQQLAREVAAEKNRLVKFLAPFYREESKAHVVAERCDKLAYWAAHMRCAFANEPTPQMAELVLTRMNDAMEGRPLIQWPNVGISPG